MDWKREGKWLALMAGVFLACFYLPVGWSRFDQATLESLALVKWYAREHVLLCLVPAFFIAGAVGVFVSQASVMKYLGVRANKVLAYGVASVSGTILAVCSCTILPLFAGIYRMGAGLGPACTFLYSGPAINILAIVLTARILGLELGVARAVGAVVFSIVIGLCMHFIFRKEEAEKALQQAEMPDAESGRPLWQTALYFAAMVGILVFANWGKPQKETSVVIFDKSGDGHHLLNGQMLASTEKEFTIRVSHATLYRASPGEVVTIDRAKYETDGATLDVKTVPVMGPWKMIYDYKWRIATGFAVALAVFLLLWFGVAWWKMVGVGVPVAGLALGFPHEPMIPFVAAFVGLSLITGTQKGEMQEWFSSSWTFAKQILPLLLFGVLIAGLLLGRPDHEGLIPSNWVAQAVGGNSIQANLFASVAGAFMYFATLTEVPILQGLIGSGMGKGPALALLLAGPALSLPNMLVIRSVMGTKKTVVFVLLVIVMAALSGMLFGAIFS
jgi:uncharacterized membrane protein YraQ (UPF0718 family)